MARNGAYRAKSAYPLVARPDRFRRGDALPSCALLPPPIGSDARLTHYCVIGSICREARDHRGRPQVHEDEPSTDGTLQLREMVRRLSSGGRAHGESMSYCPWLARRNLTRSTLVGSRLH